jgi:hypothetical protein
MGIVLFDSSSKPKYMNRVTMEVTEIEFRQKYITRRMASV